MLTDEECPNFLKRHTRPLQVSRMSSCLALAFGPPTSVDGWITDLLNRNRSDTTACAFITFKTCSLYLLCSRRKLPNDLRWSTRGMCELWGRKSSIISRITI
jgi:hypothetical protein